MSEYTDKTLEYPSISMHYDFAMGSEDYCQGYFIKYIKDWV